MDVDNEAQPTFPALKTQDQLLTAFVNAANNHGLELSVTLTVKGVVVSGTLISAKQFLRELGSITKGAKGNAAEAFGNAFEQLADDISETAQASYIHLRNARICAPGQAPMPAEGSLWRGSLASVDGWYLGELR
ncbi:gas vesicle accessory protein GvpU [Alicyclobacillus macrosporangiidus]|uniref:gas vesicle accessory protein GvpU n=1 Tax=Alicyclobacillus macrosporangiidus TaxID=392015 RepID=UPI000557532F|nr:gas vesicle accessory protein GvpU [Alicyclobacillus macrosporangiidus]